MKHPKVVAIGEFGLDNTKPKFEQQEKVFKQHIKLALKTKKPMVLHIRGSNALGNIQAILNDIRMITLSIFYKEWSINNVLVN